MTTRNLLIAAATFSAVAVLGLGVCYAAAPDFCHGVWIGFKSALWYIAVPARGALVG